ncbi:MAG: hypothetical protein LOD92_07850 [Bacillales bacterium]
MKKKLVYFLLVIASLPVMAVLYKNQLGAVYFFILAVIFFALAIKGFRGEEDEGKNNS